MQVAPFSCKWGRLQETKLRDCGIIAGGPTGLTAAIYLSR
ncbi:ribulose 1,5-bisphosphate synthetase/thiazole synthase [Rhizobium sp. BK619]|nr:ribulose 1,5-bisphosphate synthetase/thiazole synthase [Rhizobium sp. BK619]